VVIGARSYESPPLIRYLNICVRSLMARGRFDGVEVHWLFPTGLIGILAARLRRIPMVVYAHGHDAVVTPRRNGVFRWLCTLVCRNAAVVVTNSSHTAAYLRRLGADPVVIHPGVDLSRFHPTPRAVPGRVLYLGGSLEGYRKGLDIAIRLADTIAGPGIRELDPRDVASLIAEHDVVLMPSREEAFGLVAAEAIACGRWVVATKVGGLQEVVIDGLNGFLVADGDYRSALARVPDYDPFQVAATANRFGSDLESRRMAELWQRVLGETSARRSQSKRGT
jgi:glycosyltransferase involved in cell wall biosynthesis